MNNVQCWFLVEENRGGCYQKERKGKKEDCSQFETNPFEGDMISNHKLLSLGHTALLYDSLANEDHE
ncbi:MAG TPA: hypothetical protein VGO47_02100 [Chlamydiales bacterium]|nr:hypothetical protein [Chlamydiales bacterium]